MRKSFVAGIAAIALCGANALATDLPVKAPVNPAIGPAFGWSGLYIGVNGGYGWGRDHSFYDSAPPIISSLDPKGGFFGGQIGYNYYFAPRWVIGYEADFSAGSIRDSGLVPNAFALTIAANSKTDYFGTARARLGYAFDHWLIYATGGTAWAHNKFLEAVTATGVVLISRDQFYYGWTAGGGVEYALNQNWSVKAEYLFADLGKNTDVTSLGGGSVVRNTEQKLNLVRFGLNYRFDGSAPTADSPTYPLKARPMQVASPWSGSYVGIHGGYGWGHSNVFDSGNLNASSLDPSGGFGGFQVGYDWQYRPNWIFGLVSETSFGSLMKNGLSSPAADPVTIKVNTFGSERARLGFLAANNVLIYGTGGLAWAHLKFNDPAVFTPMFIDTYRIGWTGGGGFEYAFAPKWTAKIEYLYADFGTYRDAISNNGGVLFPRTASLTENTVKVGIDYHGSILNTLFGH